jgi:hypothetical protein
MRLNLRSWTSATALEISRGTGRVFGAVALAALTGCLTGSPMTTDDDDGTGSETGSTSDTGDEGAPEVCTRWVACSAVIDPDTEMASKYGAEGSCWQADAAEQADCIKLCDGQLHSYAKAFPDEPACSVEGLPMSAQFTIGEAVFDPNDPLAEPTFRELKDGDAMKIVRGGQGLLMLPFGVRGSGFEVPADPNAWDDPKMPHVDMYVDIEGANVGFGGHFSRLNEYPIGFVEVDGALEHMYIAIIVPDAIDDPQQLVNKAGVVHMELRTYMNTTVAQDIEFVVAPEIQEM